MPVSAIVTEPLRNQASKAAHGSTYLLGSVSRGTQIWDVVIRGGGESHRCKATAVRIVILEHVREIYQYRRSG